MDYIVNHDVSYHILAYLSLIDKLHLSKLNSSLYQLVSSTPLFKELSLLSDADHKLTACIKWRLWMVLELLHTKNKIDLTTVELAPLVILSGDMSVFEWFSSRGYAFMKDPLLIIEMAAESNNITILDWLVNNQYSLKFIGDSIIIAAERGNIEILQWFESHHVKFKNVQIAVNWAVMNNHLHVMEWFYCRPHYKHSYNEETIDQLITSNCLPVLQWLANHHYPICCSDRACYLAAAHGYIELIEWLHFHQLINDPRNEMIDAAVSRNCLSMLECYQRNHFKIKYRHAIDIATSKGNLVILNWFHQNAIKFKYTTVALDRASANNHLAVLQWYQSHHYELKYQKAIDRAATNGHLVVLHWWYKIHSTHLKYTKKAIDGAAMNNHLKVLDWFNDCHLPIIYTQNLMNRLIAVSKVTVLDWFKSHNYPIIFQSELKMVNRCIANRNVISLQWLKINGSTEIKQRLAGYCDS